MLKEQEKQLLQYGKHIEFGRYKNLITQPLTTFWDDEGFPGFKRRRTQRKAWIFFGIYSKDFYVGMAIVDAGMVSTAFTYFYVPSENLFIEDKTTLPLGFKNNFDPSLTDDWSLGKYSIRTTHQMMSLNYKGKYKLEITAHLLDNGVSIVAPSEGNRPFNFTYKDLPIPVQCKIDYRGKVYEIEGAYGAIDFTKGYPPRQTEWNWSSAIGKTESGKSIAFNIVNKFNSNMENILWLDKERILLSDAKFTYGPDLKNDIWRIETNDSILKMQLQPLGARQENLNAAIMKSVFIQPFGEYTGTITVNGVKENFTAWGVAEEHLAVW
ncbi:MAG: DUF2804 domain-containing protein [Chitinophagales bacterium]|nr:DUF2804 domain-containing protein [Chitinophagales bacterium]